MKTNLTHRQINDINSQQVFTLERKIHKAEFSIESVGDYLPGNILVTDLNKLATVYMNSSGCNILKHSVQELEEQGPDYFQHFFVPDEIGSIVQTYLKMQQRQDTGEVFSFVHRVKAKNESSFTWYFACAKLMYNPDEITSSKILLIVNTVNSMGNISKKINSD